LSGLASLIPLAILVIITGGIARLAAGLPAGHGARVDSIADGAPALAQSDLNR
jgi:hypothetical protein